MVKKVLVSVLLLAALSSCKFQDLLTAPRGAAVLEVESVLNASDARQTVLVEESQAGNTATGVGGAIVQLTDSTPRGCATPVVQLTETEPRNEPRPGAYTALFCPLAAGDRVSLRVTLPDGHVVSGATHVPGLGSVAVSVGGAVATGAGDTLTMNRTRDTLRVTAGLIDARALEVEAVRTTAGEPASLNVVTDTTAVVVPGDLVRRVSDTVRSVLRAGAYYHLTVAATDTNYFDFVRSATNSFTGTRYINHLNGAIGVFGSVAPISFVLRVVAPQRDPREGLYRITGSVAGASVDVTWNVYGDPNDTTTFRAFVDGQWVDGAIHTDADGAFGGNSFQGVLFKPTVPDTASPAYLLTGKRAAPGTPFKLLVSQPGVATMDTVLAVQIKSP